MSFTILPKVNNLNCQKIKMSIKFTPEFIERLEPNEVFVFGSNGGGAHAGGAAKVAYNHFGAVWGVGEGLTGRSYAIPTLNSDMQKVTKGELKASLIKFIGFVLENPNLTFYLTKIGCGIAGWQLEEVKAIFWEAMANQQIESKEQLPANLIIPEEFYD